MIGVHVEISDICRVFTMFLGNGGCVGVACLVHFFIFFVYFEKKLELHAPENFHIS